MRGRDFGGQGQHLGRGVDAGEAPARMRPCHRLHLAAATRAEEAKKQAQQMAYDAARKIHFDGAQYRRDIGHRAVKN